MLKNGFWIFLFALLVLFFFLPSFSRMQDLKVKNLKYEAEIIKFTEKNAQLTEEKRRLVEDSVYLEQVGREKMGLAKEGEVVVRMMPMNAVGREKGF